MKSMTSVNEMNERTRNQRIRDDFGALLIAVYRLPLEQRKIVLEQFEKNRRTAIAERLKPADEEVCSVCNGDGYIDIDGDCGDHGWDKIGEKACPECYPPYEDPIQD